MQSRPPNRTNRVVAHDAVRGPPFERHPPFNIRGPFFASARTLELFAIARGTPGGSLVDPLGGRGGEGRDPSFKPAFMCEAALIDFLMADATVALIVRFRLLSVLSVQGRRKDGFP